MIFEVVVLGFQSHLSFIAFFDFHIMITTFHVKLYQVLDVSLSIK